jgi:signal transduction histidine kinase
MTAYQANTTVPTRTATLAVLFSMGLAAHGQSIVASGNPISTIARVFDSQLVKIEDRIGWVETELRSYPPREQYLLKTGLGFRGGRPNPDDPDPSVTLDLGKETRFDAVSLIPAQAEFLEDPGVFPKRYTIEVSNREDFAQREVLFTSGPSTQQQRDGYPVTLAAEHSARYVRLTVHEGYRKEVADVFALSEIFVTSKGEPVSFNARVAAVGSIEVSGIWSPDTITDGRTPLGSWHNGVEQQVPPGDIFKLHSADETPVWTIRIDPQKPLDRVILFPYQNPGSAESTVFPERLTVSLASDENDPGQEIVKWSNPLPGDNHPSPIIIPLSGQRGPILRLTSTGPRAPECRHSQALSEIEVWSEGRNIACDHPVIRTGGGETLTTNALTDGRDSRRNIIPVGIWLRQLIERGRIEQELSTLRQAQNRLSTDSELNATWGSAVVLGLTFLIPVFMVERRRIAAKSQLDTIRKRIASDLHDDIGSNLGCISLIARTARKDLTRLQGPQEIAQDLNEVECIARESSLAMRDIVWLLERKQDSIGDLIQRMNETANRLLREIRFSIECETSKTATRLTLDAKRHLFLFYKEAIHNVLKHSGADQVSIKLWDDHDKLALEIADNGIGACTGSNGLKPNFNKLEDRARVLAGHMEVHASAGVGTRILLLVKRSHLTSHPAMS